MAAAAAAWSLSQQERDATVERIANNISTIAFFKGLTISDDAAKTAAAAAEKKAYTAALVAARTTTGNRPVSETTSAYARKLGELVLAAVTDDAMQLDAPDAAAGSLESLDLAGSRDFLDAESARQVLAPLLAAGSAISKVRFSTKSFGVEAAAVAAEALRAVAGSLHQADMSDIIAGRPEDEALEVLRIIAAALSTAKLRHLNLSDNALGEKGVRAAAAALQHQGLEFLSLQNVGCSVHACAALQELLPAACDLQGMHLFNNMSGDEGAGHIGRLLARCPGMADFKMASSRVGAAGGISIASALTTGRSLVRLDLSDNPLTAEVAPALAALLAAQPGLKHLNLNDTGLTDEGVSVVCRALASAAPQLEVLELALNEITPGGAAVVAAALANKQHLTRLNLRENELEDAGAAVLARGLPKLTALRVLDLCSNQLTRAGVCAVARGLAAREAAAPGGFELLALDDNTISEAGLDQLRGLLKACFGSDAMLGPLDENDPDGADDDDDEDGDEAMQDEADDALTAAMAKVSL